MPALLDQLASTDPQERAGAARAIYSEGLALLERATARWLIDPEVRRHLPLKGSTLTNATVGIAVRPERFAAIRAANGSPALAEVPAEIDAREFELHFPDGARLDVLTTRDEQISGDGAIARFLNRNGEGIQQVELNVGDVNRAAAALRERLGLKPVYEEARSGADRTLVNFLLVDFTMPGGESKKLLVELVQQSDGH